MSDGLELSDSRVDRIVWEEGVASIHFSHTYIHKSKGKPGREPGTGWSQEARLILWNAAALSALPVLPATISDGFLEVGGLMQELLPLPFKCKGNSGLSSG